MAILPIYQRCEADILARHRWLLDWKSSRAGRTIKLEVDITVRKNPENPEWQLAGLPGKAEFELELQQDDQGCAKVWVSSGASDSLVTWATDKWMDGMSVCHPYDHHEVIVVDASGRPQRRSLGKISK